MKHPFLLCCWALILLCLPSISWSYNLQTVLSESCHENLLGESFATIATLLGDNTALEVPSDPVLDRLLEGDALFGDASLTRRQKYVLLSLIVGVRAPDTEGHSTLDPTTLRRLHADPSPRSQYAHALRGPDDDGLKGDLRAIDGTINVIRDELAQGFRDSLTSPTTLKPIYFDYYGSVEVPVIRYVWHVGRAAHALQDAHAHAIWNADLTHIVHVLNFVDAVEGTLNPPTDGLAHSGALDDCTRPEVAPMLQKARASTSSLLFAAIAYARGDDTLLEAGLAPCQADDATDPSTCGWVVYNPACRANLQAGTPFATGQACCTQDNALCGSPFYPLALKDPAGPYLSCQHTGGPGPGQVPWLWVLGLLGALGARRRWAAPRALLPTLICLLLAFDASEVHAQEPADPYLASGRLMLGVQGHGAIIDDRINSSVLAPSFGFGVRAGWRWGRWRMIGQVERDYWVAVELEPELDLGVLNFGLGAEVLFHGGLVRSSIMLGASVLWFDTLFHDKGTTGGFGELRPLGIRWNTWGNMFLVFDPITTTVSAPYTNRVNGERLPTLSRIERRTILGVEASFF